MINKEQGTRLVEDFMSTTKEIMNVMKSQELLDLELIKEYNKIKKKVVEVNEEIENNG